MQYDATALPTDPYGAIGPQTDGTWNAPAVAQPVQPQDTSGGAPASYGADTLALLKYGVGVWQQNQQQGRMVDYAQWQATNAGLVRSGTPLGVGLTATGRNPSSLYLFGGLILAAVLIMHNKG